VFLEPAFHSGSIAIASERTTSASSRERSGGSDAVAFVDEDGARSSAWGRRRPR
jgi:hypothetical protein